MQSCGISSVLARETLQSWTKPLICCHLTTGNQLKKIFFPVLLMFLCSWVVINRVLWHSHERNRKWSLVKISVCKVCLKINYTFDIPPTSPWGQWVKETIMTISMSGLFVEQETFSREVGSFVQIYLPVYEILFFSLSLMVDWWCEIQILVMLVQVVVELIGPWEIWMKF